MIQVVGHLNPDSDAICSAWVTAKWLARQGRKAQAWRAGALNRETQFIFDRAGLEPPPLLDISLENQAVWLVDFTELAQGPETLSGSNIIGIVDHHRLGGLVTSLPPEVWIKPVGSTATVLWQIMLPEQRQALTSAECTLLLGAIFSDTVALRSPTTTQDDRNAAEVLNLRAGVDTQQFAKELLRAKTDIAGLDAETLLRKDLKRFDFSSTQVWVAQLELADIDQATPLLPALRAEMARLQSSQHADLVVLMLTDISQPASCLHFVGSALPGAKPCTIPGMLSRKKQLLPWLENQLTLSGGKL
ncbi:manganese-dependent inorganic pyrophosphatase [Mangrovibacter yixingensis]|uniref:manganese-dependent inorganic pyrophosphatase n=1 Tax=Mangrovibacter yixingensis TaxID=1529639 RepID=UPI001CFED84E|nr:manganese-dependent inorganic pyrophosphatase [Mangrovibacter yixingensis]